MAEYYPLLSRAVAALRDAPAESRRALYGRARDALLGQLRSMQPPVPEADIQRESQALEEAVARLEAEIGVEAALKEQFAAPPPAAVEPTPPAPPVVPPPPPPAAPGPEPEREPAAPPVVEAAPTPPPQPAAPEIAAPQPVVPEPAAPTTPAPPAVAPPAPTAAPVTPPPVVAAMVRPAAPGARGLTSLRAGTSSLSTRPISGGQPIPSPRKPATPGKSDAPRLRAVEPPVAPLPAAPRLQVTIAARDIADTTSAEVPTAPVEEPRPEPVEAEAARGPARDDMVRPAAPRPVTRERVNPRLLIVAIVAAFVVAGIAYTAWRLRDKPEALARSRAALQAAQRAEQQPGKIVSRADDGASAPPTILADKTPVGDKPAPSGDPAPSMAASTPSAATSVLADQPAGATAPDASAPSTAAAPVSGTAPAPADAGATSPVPTPTPTISPAPASSETAAPAASPAPTADQGAVPVAQRAALLVDAPEDPAKLKTYVGTVVWRTESVSAGQGQPLATVVRATVDVPDAKATLNVLFQKNFEAQFPASHTIELRFAQGAGNTLGNVKQINVPQMRRDDAATGDALTGVPVTITDNYFLVGLSRGDAEARNLDLIRTRNWIDVPLMLASGKVAKVTFEKGTTGQRMIEDAVQSWQ